MEGATGSPWAGRSARAPEPAGHPARRPPRASGLPPSLPRDVCPLHVCRHSRSAPPAGPVTGGGVGTGGELGVRRDGAHGGPPGRAFPVHAGDSGRRRCIQGPPGQCLRVLLLIPAPCTRGSPRVMTETRGVSGDGGPAPRGASSPTVRGRGSSACPLCWGKRRQR